MAGASHMVGGGTTIGPLSVTSAPAGRTVFYSTGGRKVTGLCTATPVGGVGPYVFEWDYVDGDTEPLPTSPSGPVTAWAATVASGYVNYSCHWRVKVTDSVGTVAYAVDVVLILFTGNA